VSNSSLVVLILTTKVSKFIYRTEIKSVSYILRFNFSVTLIVNCLPSLLLSVGVFQICIA